jgi:hypothetical protein
VRARVNEQTCWRKRLGRVKERRKGIPPEQEITGKEGVSVRLFCEAYRQYVYEWKRGIVVGF